MLHRKTAPQPKEKRKVKADRMLPRAPMTNGTLVMVRIKNSKMRWCFEIQLHSGRSLVTKLYRHKRYLPALHAFNRRVRRDAIDAAIRALGL